MIAERKSANITQEDLGALLSKPQSFVSKYERGERRLGIIEFIQIIKAMNRSPEVVLKRVVDQLGKS